MLYAFEGIDGSGKATQAELLTKRMSTALHDEWRAKPDAERVFKGAALWSFPQYNRTFAGPKIKQYLRGESGSLSDNDPFLVSLLYALDRHESRDVLIHQVATCGIVLICDRYVPSNVAHQAGKLWLPNSDVWRDIAHDIETVEYRILGMPQPDLVFYMDLTPQQSFRRTHARDTEPDLHQDDLGYLQQTRNVYLHYARTYKIWHLLQCFDGERERTVTEIHDEVWAIADEHRKQQAAIMLS